MAIPYRGLAASLALHGALVLALIFEWPTERKLDTVPAPEAVTVSFAAQAGAPDSEPNPKLPPIEEAIPVQQADEIENIDPEEVTAVEPEPETASQPEPPPPAPVAPPEIATLLPPETVAAAEPKPPEVEKKKPDAETAKIVEQPEPAKKTEDAVESEQPQPAPEGTAPKSASAIASSRDPTYPDLLLAWLQQKLIYPPKAERRGLEGTATVWLSIDSTGQVLGYRILKSTGHRILDKEVEALIERADPMPPVPDGEQAPSLEFIIPVDFNIR